MRKVWIGGLDVYEAYKVPAHETFLVGSLDSLLCNSDVGKYEVLDYLMVLPDNAQLHDGEWWIVTESLMHTRGFKAYQLEQLFNTESAAKAHTVNCLLERAKVLTELANKIEKGIR